MGYAFPLIDEYEVPDYADVRNAINTELDVARKSTGVDEDGDQLVASEEGDV